MVSLSPLPLSLPTNLFHDEKDVSPSYEALDRLTAELQRIERERRAIQELIDAHNALLAPVRRAPDDVLSEIFVHCLPENYNATRSLSEAPLLLGQVCRRWRQVSLSTPRLWTSLHTVIPTDTDPDVLCTILESRRKGVESWLGRSGVLPLSISVFSRFQSHRRHEEVVASVRRLMDSFTRLSSRWQNVEMKLSDECFGILRESMDSVGAAWGGNSLPLLDAIKLEIVDRKQVVVSDTVKKTELEFLSKFGGSPRLTSMSFISTAYCSHDLSLPLGNLSKLDLSPAGQLHLTNDEVLQLLSQCTNVRYCRLPKVLMLTRLSSSVELPHLQNLHARIKTSSDYPREPVTSASGDQIRFHTILDCISAPALQTLTVEFESYSTSRPLSQVPFISLLKPGNQIEQLDISMNISGQGMVECLQLTPKLRDLRLCNSRDSDTCSSVVSALIPSDEKPMVLCPSLRRLCLFNKDHKVSDELLLKLACARRDPKNLALGMTSLEVLRAKLDRHRQIVDLERRVNGLRCAGLDIVLTHMADGEDVSWYGQVRKTSCASVENALSFWN